MFRFLVTKQQGTINKTMSCTNVSWCLSFLLGRPTRSCYQQTNDDLDCDSRPSWTVHRNRAGWLRENAEDAWKFTSIEGIQVMPPVKTNRNGFVAFPLIFFCTCDWLNSARMQQHVRNTEGFNNARWAIGNACHMWAAQVLATLPLKPTLGNHVSSMDPEGENTFAHERKMNKTLGNPKWELNKLAGNQDSFVA